MHAKSILHFFNPFATKKRIFKEKRLVHELEAGELSDVASFREQEYKEQIRDYQKVLDTIMTAEEGAETAPEIVAYRQEYPSPEEIKSFISRLDAFDVNFS